MDVSWYGPEPRRYRRPLETIEAYARSAVAGAFERADEALAGGYSIAGFVAYEAGRRDGPDAYVPGDEPLVALGIYDGPEFGLALAPPEGEARLGPLVATIERARYEADLDAIARALHEGDAYQVNYTVPFGFTYTGDASALAARLRARTPVPYAAFVRHRGRALVSLSPELFFAIDGERIETRPMKGTAEPDADLGDPKNRAEHVMIVDLLRNDLHRICDEVAVETLMAVERYRTFITLTSTIVGRLRPETRLDRIFRALFPCGSITGAPKRSAMATIARLEAAARGVAMGAIGYCDAPRRGMWNVAIRTATLDERSHTGDLRIGGGIVAASRASDEWAEILVKRRAYDAVATRVGLFETIGIAADGGCARASAHLARFERSAFALAIPYDADAVRAAFESARAGIAGARLVRLALAPDGELAVRVRPLEAVPARSRACVARVRLNAHDPTLRHKTDARDAYDAASADATAAGCFDALLLNQYGRLADGARTTIFVADRDGRFATPPLRDGALADLADRLDRDTKLEFIARDDPRAAAVARQRGTRDAARDLGSRAGVRHLTRSRGRS
ncbi:MAG: aminodeoxychorismate synthase component I [Vulcanimicrobiaceae bacterium]